MAGRGPSVPTLKSIRAKIANQTQTKEPPQKNPLKQNPSKTAPPLEPRVVVAPVVPVGVSLKIKPISIHPTNQTNS